MLPAPSFIRVIGVLRADGHCQHNSSPASTAAAMEITGVILGATAGVGLALFGVPAVVSVLGFKATGIAAGSVAAKMMSAAAIANSGGVAAGSIVSVLQSVGAAGLSAGAKIGLTSALGTLGGIVGATKP